MLAETTTIQGCVHDEERGRRGTVRGTSCVVHPVVHADIKSTLRNRHVRDLLRVCHLACDSHATVDVFQENAVGQLQVRAIGAIYAIHMPRRRRFPNLSHERGEIAVAF